LVERSGDANLRRVTKLVLVTGSASGIGLETAKMLMAAGHRVVLHARSPERAEAAMAGVPEAVGVVVGDLSSLRETEGLATDARSIGPFDAVIHNAGIYEDGDRTVTTDGLERTFQVNVLAPYLLTASLPLPGRLIYLTSGMASGGQIDVGDLQRERRSWSATGAYRDSKLCDIALAMAMARRYPGTVTNAVCPGWVRTRMGGRGAPSDVRTGAATQVWLAGSDEPEALRSGRYMRHMKELVVPGQGADTAVQEALIDACRRLSGIGLPEPRPGAGV
jgi:NAD(P)-dependent dehydrogenase (short-subunit alcohol dehydrogenase family)